MIQQKVNTLLSRMSLAQKVGQMTQPERSSISPQDIRAFHIGSVLSGAGSSPGDNTLGDWVGWCDEVWAASTAADTEHLAIPALNGLDAVHGNNNVRGATLFPHNIGLGAANDPDLIERIARVTAREVLASGIEWSFAPALAVVRDCHWGRTYESYAEEPQLVANYAGKFVRGLQGDLTTDGVLACAKHWVGDGGTRDGIDQGDTTVDMDELERMHMAAYYQAIDAGVLTVMASLSSWRGEKCHGHHHLLTEVLKNKLGFSGYIVSDWDGIDYLGDYYYDAIATGVNAGIDMFMVSQNWHPFIAHLIHHVETGTVAMARIDDAVRRILTVKFAIGLFDKPLPSLRAGSRHASFGSPEHREVAREAVRKSLVLLKNDDQILPLASSCKLLVAGKSAHNRGHQCGGFTLSWQGESGNDVIEGGTSIWEGIQSVAPQATLSTAALGEDADPGLHDIAIVVIGETPYAEGMGDIREGDYLDVQPGSQVNGSGCPINAMGHSMELAILHPQDLQTITNICSKGIPVIAVMISGRPLIVTPELAAASAFVAAWLPGSEGQGLADVLFGDYDFTGKLSFSWPGSSTAGAGPVFPYGFGMSYQPVG